MKFLKKLSDLSPTDSLKYRLHRYLGDFDEHRGLERLHASEFTRDDGACPRLYALGGIMELELPERDTSTSEAVTFEIGNMVQDRIVNWFADMQIAVCHWKCLACGTMTEWSKRPKKCSCGCTAFKPIEPRLVSKKSGLSCGIDLLFERSDNMLEIVELKTMDKELFKPLAAPLAEHRLRTNLYLRIAQESGHPMAKKIDPKNGRVLYVSKGGYGIADPQLKKWGLSESFSPLKEYAVKRQDEDTDEISKRGAAVHLFRQGKAGMPCGVCSTAFTARAKECPAKKPCFSGAYPATQDWTT